MSRSSVGLLHEVLQGHALWDRRAAAWVRDRLPLREAPDGRGHEPRRVGALLQPLASQLGSRRRANKRLGLGPVDEPAVQAAKCMEVTAHLDA